ncbi:MAG: TolC family protein [Candidatus Eremiobacteraeota bacterium]|nr:TolC family protein [Candidatus Eremiobacteraeota bacterium]
MIGIAAVVLAVVPGFTDLSLDAAESRTVANSATVATAQAVVRQRAADLSVARLGGIPHLTGDYSLSPQAAPTGTSTVEQHFITVGAGVSLNDILAKSTTTRVAAAELLAAQRDAETAALQARAAGIKLYFAALSAIAVESVRREALRNAQRELSAANLRARNGEAPKIDVLRAGVSVAQAQADLALAHSERENAVDALASATNVAPDILQQIGGVEAPQPNPPLNVTTDVTRALAMRPELASLLASIAAKRAGVDVARQAGWPSATLAGGYQGGVDTAIPVHGPQAAVHVDVPLASGERGRVAGAQAQVEAAQAQLLDARRTISLDVAAAVRTVTATQTAEAAAARAREQARRTLVAVELGYREGASSSLDVAEARRTYVQASVDALIAAYDHAQALALLEVFVP